MHADCTQMQETSVTFYLRQIICVKKKAPDISGAFYRQVVVLLFDEVINNLELLAVGGVHSV